MRIKQKLGLHFLLISLVALGTSFGISLTIQDKIVTIARQVAGERLPGAIALAQMEATLYQTYYLLENYTANPDHPGEAEIEANLSALAKHQTAHALYHPQDPFVNYLEAFTQKFSRAVTEYLTLIRSAPTGSDQQQLNEEIASLMQEFKTSIGAHIDAEQKSSYLKVGEILSLDQRTHRLLLIASAVILLSTLLLSLAFAHLLTVPLRTLTQAAGRIGAGDWQEQIPIRSKDELGELAGAFNEMSANLQVVSADLEESNRQLEAELIENQSLNRELTFQRDNLEQAVAERTSELEEQKRVAVSASEAKSQFLANMSHEIRTPMNAILGMAYLALKTELTEQQRNYISKLHYSAETLLGILNDILDISKVEAGKLGFETIPFDLDDVIDNCLTVLKHKARQNRIKISVEVASQLPTALIGDPLRLGQVLINLVGNAIKFSHQGGTVELTVVLEEQVQSKIRLRFSVIDHGIGMTAAEQAGLFQTFYQADSSTTRKYGGTGLGLAISRSVTELMGGRIWVESEVNVGSSFHFTAEFGIQQPGTGITANDYGECGLEATLASLAGTRLLVVEDNPHNRELLVEALVLYDMQVETAVNGEDALEVLARDEFDCILLDCQMPVMDGYETARRIREQDAYRELPIIALTGNAMEADRDKAIAAGMNDHMAKPIRFNEMFAKIAFWVHR